MKKNIRKKLATLGLAFVIAFTSMPVTNTFAKAPEPLKIYRSLNEKNMPTGLATGVYYRIRNAKTNQYLTTDKYGSLKLVNRNQAVLNGNSLFLITKYGSTKYRIFNYANNYYLNLYKTTVGCLNRATLEKLSVTAQNSTYFNLRRGNVDSSASGLYFIDSSNSSYAMTATSPYVKGKSISYQSGYDANSTWAFEQVAECDKGNVLFSSYIDKKVEAAHAKRAANAVINWANTTVKKVTAYYQNEQNLAGHVVSKRAYLKYMETATTITSFGHAGEDNYSISPTETINLFGVATENCLSQCKLAILAGCNTAGSWNSGNICKTFYDYGVHTIIGFTQKMDSDTTSMYVKYFYEYAKSNNLATVAECNNYAINRTREEASFINRFSQGAIPSLLNTRICGDRNALVNY